MKRTIQKIALLSLITVIVFLAACAPMTDAQREAREYSRVEFRNKFIDDRARCAASGRRIVVQGNGGALDSDGIPRTRVWYVCS